MTPTDKSTDQAVHIAASLDVGGGEIMSFINPQLRPEHDASADAISSLEALLNSYDHLLSDKISTDEAIRRLKLMRDRRAVLAKNDK